MPIGTAFQREVWSTLAEIPYGQTWSYGDVARRIGKPQAVRAVGAANGRNPIPIVVPCHRVIGADGRSEEHTSELQSLMRISYAVFCLKKKTNAKNQNRNRHK